MKKMGESVWFYLFCLMSILWITFLSYKIDSERYINVALNHKVYQFRFPLLTIVHISGISYAYDYASGLTLKENAISIAIQVFSWGRIRTIYIATDGKGNIEDVKGIGGLLDVASNYKAISFRICWNKRGENPRFRVRKPRWD